jgi:adenylate cyclase
LVERTSATRIARLEQRRNEDQVLAESSVEGEKRVAIARLALLGLFTLSSQISMALGDRLAPSALRLAGLLPYAFFAVAAPFVLRRVVPRPSKARWVPVLITAIDFAFLTYMAAVDYREHGTVFPEMGAIAFAAVLCFSVARYHWLHVAWSTALAIACYLGIGLATDRLEAISGPFVLGGFAGLGLLIGMTNASVRRMFTGIRRRDNLTRFLPRAVAEHVLHGGEAALQPVQREVTVLFSDIRDFTSLAESLAPRAVLELLDEYFGHMTQIVKGHDGVVNKFLGDGMLAFWGVPDRIPDHAERAVRAAADMRRVVEELNLVREARGERPLRIGVGVHTGTVAAGMLGGADQHEYTVIGDAVNVASRIEGLTKTLGVDILVSESTWNLVNGRFGGERLAEETIRGRKEPVVVYALR